MKLLAAVQPSTATTLAAAPRPTPASASITTDAPAPGQSGLIRVPRYADVHAIRTSDSSFRW